MIKGKWIGLVAVALIAGSIIAYKRHLSLEPQASTAGPPRVLLVVDMSEANSAGDACAEIIHLVQAARDRGIAVQELSPGSKQSGETRESLDCSPKVGLRANLFGTGPVNC